MVRQGLGQQWHCMFANDVDLKKCKTYSHNWGSDVLNNKNVDKLTTNDLSGKPGMVWASFPCQDLSVAGRGAGLCGKRSCTFWSFWRLVEKMKTKENNAPQLVVLETVCGTLTSRKGKDFAAIINALRKANYRPGALVINAAAFVPQLRPRLFIIAVRKQKIIPADLIRKEPCPSCHTKTLCSAYNQLTRKNRENWIWWNLAAPRKNPGRLADIIEENPRSVKWHTKKETAQLLATMSPTNSKKVSEAQKQNGRVIGTIFKRTRREKNGQKVLRAEVRFDGIAGCLRTPAGGASHQIVIIIDRIHVRTRLISSRETARLMGLPEKYQLPKNYNETCHLTGDGVAAPVVRHLAKNILEPILRK